MKKKDADRIREQEKKHEFPKDLFLEACKLGFFGAWIPEKYGGQGLGVLERCLIGVALCTVDLDPMFGFLDAGLFGSEAISLHGTEEQKEEYLNKIPKGEMIFASGFTEPSGGTDVASVRTTPIEKVKKRHQGLSQIIVPTNAKGFSAEVVEKLGVNYAPTHNVVFQDVCVPVKNLIGTEGSGFYQAMQFFDFTRPWVGAMAVGFAQCAFNEALSYSKQRELFGQKLGFFPGTPV